MNTTTDMALHNRKIWCFSIFYFSFNVIELVQIKDSHQDTHLLIPIFLLVGLLLHAVLPVLIKA